MEKYNKWMQYFWLSIALISGVYAIFSYYTSNGEPVEILIYVMPFLALALFLMRYWHHKKLESLKKKDAAKQKQD
ncbi:MAG: hypothetical protein KDC83_05980 [Flavobacteriales bacterium]|nr:hypothetical protein [Flavobacteriales bacterium]